MMQYQGVGVGVNDVALDDVGVDTVRLCLDTPQVGPGCLLQVKAAHELKGRRQWWNGTFWKDVQGKEVKGALAWWNGGGVHVEAFLTHGGAAPLWTVTFSVAKCAHGDNLYAANRQEFERVIAHVSQTLSNIGIETDIWGATLSRVDLFCNAILSRPISEHLSLLQSFEPPHNKKTKVFPTGVILGNTQFEWAGYDKGLEIKARGGKALPVINRLKRRGVDLDQLNVLRLEFRARTAGSTRRHLQMDTLADLQRCYDEIVPLYQGLLRRHLFRNDPRDKQQPHQSTYPLKAAVSFPASFPMPASASGFGKVRERQLQMACMI